MTFSYGVDSLGIKKFLPFVRNELGICAPTNPPLAITSQVLTDFECDRSDGHVNAKEIVKMKVLAVGMVDGEVCLCR